MRWFCGLIVTSGLILARDFIPPDYFTTVKTLVAECQDIADAFKPFSPTGIHVATFTYDNVTMEFKKYFYENNSNSTIEVIHKIDAKDKEIETYQFEIQSNGKNWDIGGFYVVLNRQEFVGVYNGREIGRTRERSTYLLLGRHIYRAHGSEMYPASQASIDNPTNFQFIGEFSAVVTYYSIIATRHDIGAINYLGWNQTECKQLDKPQYEWMQLVKCTPLQPVLEKNGMTPEYYSLVALKLLYPKCFNGLGATRLKNTLVRFQHKAEDQEADEEEQGTRFIIYIVAGVLGLLGFILLIIGIIIFCICRKRKASEKEIKVIVVKEPEESSTLTPNKHPEGSRNNNQDSKKNKKPSKHSDTVPEQSANSGDTEKKTNDKNKEKVKEETVTVTSNEKPTENDTQPPTEHSKESKNKVGKGQIPKHNDWPIPEKKDKLDITDLRRKRDHSLEIE